LYNIPQPETKEKTFLEFVTAKARNQKPQKITFLLKSQNLFEIQAKQKQHADHKVNDTFACFIHKGK